jgi:acetyltransferase-like isoleucine patch superfamily enzyme
MEKNINAKIISIGENCYIGNNVQFNIRGTFKIGDCSYIGDNCIIDCQDFIAGDYLYMADNVEIGRGGNKNPDSICMIGNHVGIFENTVINVNSPVTIGNDVGIGAEVMLWTHGAWLDPLNGFPYDFGPITIGNNVWLPARSIMLPNTSIGDNTVIGIGSIITKNIPSNCMAAGTPCKVLRENVYPNPIGNESKIIFIENIIEYWKTTLVNHKQITTVLNVWYDNSQDCIILEQANNITKYYLTSKIIEGIMDNVAEDLRDYLRRHGIKYYTGLPFKSINI